MNHGDRHELYPHISIVKRQAVNWPGNARIAMWVVPNIEHQTLVSDGSTLDVPWYSRLHYANRVGVWRIMSVLDRFGVRGTVAVDSSVCRHYPEVVFESAGTLDVLRDAGIQYVCDGVNDDLPYRFNNGLWSIPYTNELNDMRIMRPPIYGGDEWGDLVKRAFARLYDEGSDLRCVFSLALHSFVTGLPGRICILEDILEFISSHNHVWKATGQEIIDHYWMHAT